MKIMVNGWDGLIKYAEYLEHNQYDFTVYQESEDLFLITIKYQKEVF